jgi:hypothetical protein
MVRGHKGQRFRRPPRFQWEGCREITADDLAAGERFFASTGLPSHQCWYEVLPGRGGAYFVLQIGPDWRDPVPPIPPSFEGRPVFSEPGRVELCAA